MKKANTYQGGRHGWRKPYIIDVSARQDLAGFLFLHTRNKDRKRASMLRPKQADLNIGAPTVWMLSWTLKTS